MTPRGRTRRVGVDSSGTRPTVPASWHCQSLSVSGHSLPQIMTSFARQKASLARPKTSLVRPKTSFARPKASLSRPRPSLATPKTSSTRPNTPAACPKAPVGCPKTSSAWPWQSQLAGGTGKPVGQASRLAGSLLALPVGAGGMRPGIQPRAYAGAPLDEVAGHLTRRGGLGKLEGTSAKARVPRYECLEGTIPKL